MTTTCPEARARRPGRAVAPPQGPCRRRRGAAPAARDAARRRPAGRGRRACGWPAGRGRRSRVRDPDRRRHGRRGREVGAVVHDLHGLPPARAADHLVARRLRDDEGADAPVDPWHQPALEEPSRRGPAAPGSRSGTAPGARGASPARRRYDGADERGENTGIPFSASMHHVVPTAREPATQQLPPDPRVEAELPAATLARRIPSRTSHGRWCASRAVRKSTGAPASREGASRTPTRSARSRRPGSARDRAS